MAVKNYNFDWGNQIVGSSAPAPASYMNTNTWSQPDVLSFGSSYDNVLNPSTMGFESPGASALGSNTEGLFGFNPESFSLDFGGNGVASGLGGNPSFLDQLGGWGGALQGAGSVANIASSLASIGLGAANHKEGKKMNSFYRDSITEQMALKKQLINREVNKDNYNRIAMGGSTNLPDGAFI